MYTIVTGAAGFIGSNIVKALNERGVTDIIAVDNLKRADKFKNLIDCEVDDYLDKQQFIDIIEAGHLDGAVEAILHQGACSDTMEQDGHYMMENNFRYSSSLLEFALDQEVPLIYASSASVYGGGSVFSESREHEGPLNVYGPREQHKGRMASVAFHHFNQYKAEGKVKLFEGIDGYVNGGQSRDFIYVGDVVKVNLHFLDSPQTSGIFNCGTGRSQPFNDIAVATVNACRAAKGESQLTLEQMVAQGIVEYIAFPEALKGKYQSFTQADTSLLRSEGGYAGTFATVAEGVKAYVEQRIANGEGF